MKTVNSLSGGKTSSYMAVHYPADIEIFALVCIDAPKTKHKDSKVNQYVNDKILKTGNREFTGTSEDPKTLTVLMNLEQKIGKEIIWVRGESFDELIKRKKAIPNQNQRFCSYELKMRPIFQYLFNEVPVEMRLGFRYDEKERANKVTTDIDYISAINNFGQKRNKWNTIKWRDNSYPLIENHISHPTIQKYWKNSGFIFPEDSNCQMCFWKNEAQLRKNFETNPEIMEWANKKEKQTGNRFRHKMTMAQIKKLGIQKDFYFGGGVGCQEGFCGD